VTKKPGAAAGGKGRRRTRNDAGMPRACARRFVEFAAELDQHAQRLDSVETGLLIVATKAGVPF
jgi:hypothetical protein